MELPTEVNQLLNDYDELRKMMLQTLRATVQMRINLPLTTAEWKSLEENDKTTVLHQIA